MKNGINKYGGPLSQVRAKVYIFIIEPMVIYPILI